MATRKRKVEAVPETPLGDADEHTGAAETDFNPAELEALRADAPAGSVPDAAASSPGSHSGDTTQPAKTGRERPRGPGRPWTERYHQPVAYRRFTLKNERGDEEILFVVNLAPGETTPPEEVVNVFRAHKYWKNGKPHGLAEDARADDESYATGLTFGQHKKFKTAWVIKNDAFGDEVAASIDADLQAVATKLQGEPSPARR